MSPEDKSAEKILVTEDISHLTAYLENAQETLSVLDALSSLDALCSLLGVTAEELDAMMEEEDPEN